MTATGNPEESRKKVSESKEKRLSGKELANLQKRYRNITRGEKELPVIPPNLALSVANLLN